MSRTLQVVPPSVLKAPVSEPARSLFDTTNMFLVFGGSITIDGSTWLPGLLEMLMFWPGAMTVTGLGAIRPPGLLASVLISCESVSRFFGSSTVPFVVVGLGFWRLIVAAAES